MTLKEIRELLVLKEWTRAELAVRLGLCANTVNRWFCAKQSSRRIPGVAECMVMGQWLKEARADLRQPATAR